MTPTVAGYQAAYVHSPAVDPIGALRMQRACSLDTERRLYANRQQERACAAAADKQAPRKDSACCPKKGEEKKKRWETTVKFVDASPRGKEM
ncbi:hypothetical protein NpNSSI1_00000803 [Neofusicoccum parvum]|nr:hypothetical protein NpNSSI1_00000803 [Neofusicoccum parvum]